MNGNRERAIALCIHIEEEQEKLADALRESKLHDIAEAEAEMTRALETLLIPDERPRKAA